VRVYLHRDLAAKLRGQPKINSRPHGFRSEEDGEGVLRNRRSPKKRGGFGSYGGPGNVHPDQIFAGWLSRKLELATLRSTDSARLHVSSEDGQ
jgi:hypothetical protein